MPLSLPRHRHRRDPQLRPHPRRIRRRAHGRRQHRRRPRAPSPSPSTIRCRPSTTPPPGRPRSSCSRSPSPCWRSPTRCSAASGRYGRRLMSALLSAHCRKRLSRIRDGRAPGHPRRLLPSPSCSALRAPARPRCCARLPDWRAPTAGSIVFRRQTWFDAARAIDLPPQAAPRRLPLPGLRPVPAPHRRRERRLRGRARGTARRRRSDAFGLARVRRHASRAPLSGGAAAARRPGPRAGRRARAAAARRAALRARRADPRCACAPNCAACCSPAACPAIVVTHDRMEAVALGDWMAVMVDGQVHQCGPVQEVFRRPADLAVAESVGVENVLPAGVVGRDRRTAHARIGRAPAARPAPVRRWRRDRRCVRLHTRRRRRNHPRRRPVSSARNRLAGRGHVVTPEGPWRASNSIAASRWWRWSQRNRPATCDCARATACRAVIKTTSVHLVKALTTR